MVTRTGTPGDDTLVGTAGADTLIGLAGDDRLAGLAGDDRLSAGLGFDTVEPGLGNDRVYGGGPDPDDPFGNDFDLASYFPDNSVATRGVDVDLTTGRMTRGAEVDRLFDIEGVDGGRFADVIRGNSDNNRFVGNGGADRLSGGNGRDGLEGGAGDDVLHGGANGDSLFGGVGRDVFRYTDASESDFSRFFKSVDSIFRFEQGADRIDLAAVDADLTRPGDQAFAFTGRQARDYLGEAGELWFIDRPGYTAVQGNIDGSRDIEFRVQAFASDQPHTDFTAADFVL